MLKKLVAASAMSVLLVASASLTHAAAENNLAAGKLCATKLYIAAHGKSPALLLQSAYKLVNFDHVITMAAAINGDTLTANVQAKYKEGMADFAEHFAIPRLAKELQHMPHITVATLKGNALTISEGGDASLTVEQGSCRILDAKGSGVSLIGMVARHIKDNYT